MLPSVRTVANELPPRSYATPEAFRQALEKRVRSSVGGGGMARFRQVLVFDRFLARLFRHFGDRAILKGGSFSSFGSNVLERRATSTFV